MGLLFYFNEYMYVHVNHVVFFDLFHDVWFTYATSCVIK